MIMKTLKTKIKLNELQVKSLVTKAEKRNLNEVYGGIHYYTFTSQPFNGR